ncbi:MAG: arginine--tRNA ligase [Mariprofundales bacterium]|nr:arginine--tRNA ligase [Mariprofundales bacterium]
MKQQLEMAIRHYLQNTLPEGAALPEIHLSRPKQQGHGDYACNVAMQLARVLRKSPQVIAQQLVAGVDWPAVVAKAEVAGPGFLNIFLQQAAEAAVLGRAVMQGADYGRVALRDDLPRVNLEFVSANPTGPMHVGHCRGACVGDALGNVLISQGYRLQREYYINDAGAQIGVLAESVWLRMRELNGATIDFPDGCYPGEYVVGIAQGILLEHPFAVLDALDATVRQQLIAPLAVAANMAMIRGDLAALNITFDHYFSESALHDAGSVARLIAQLQHDGWVYRGTLPPPKGKEVVDYQPVEQLLFRTTKCGDEVDRPLEKQDGTPTYFAADIAYHRDKFDRGFGRQIDIWGADHGGYVARVQAAVQAVTDLVGQPEVMLVQMVNLLRNGTPVKMSKRAGTFVTLREVVDEVGADAVRFNFLTRRVESQLDFDLEAAKKQSEENPVYYVQYAHARCAAILRKADEAGLLLLPPEAVDLALLGAPEEQRLVTMMLAYPEMLATAAERLEPYRVATWLMAFAAALHRFYHKQRVMVDDAEVSQARLLLVRAVKQVLSNGLAMLGVRAPERM